MYILALVRLFTSTVMVHNRTAALVHDVDKITSS